MMKRFVAILMTLCMVMTMVPALAEEGDEESGAALNPYTSENLEATIALPSDIQVTDETAEENRVVLTLKQDGRTDVGYSISVVFDEAYEDYTMADLPDELKQQLIDYYASEYPGKNTPAFEDVSAAEPFEQYFTPFMAFGKGQDGNFYMIYVCICYGFVLTVSGGTASEAEFDEDAYGKTFNLYWQAVDMFYQFLENMGYIE